MAPPPRSDPGYGHPLTSSSSPTSSSSTYLHVSGHSPDQYTHDSRVEKTAHLAPSLLPPPTPELSPSPSSLFPLPFPCSSPHSYPRGRRHPGGSRRRQQRQQRRRAQTSGVWALIETLNRWFLGREWKRGGKGRRRRKRGGRKLQGLVLEKLRERVVQFRRGLAASGEGNEQDDISTDMTMFYSVLGHNMTPCLPLTSTNAALPPPCAKRVRLYDILPPSAVQALQRDGIRLIGPLPLEDLKLRPAMGVAPGHYLPIVMKAVERGVCELTKEVPESTQGLFGVEKGEGLARVILDCRPANRLCYPPPNPELPMIEGLTKIGTPPGTHLSAAILDLANYYHTIEMPPAWRSLFGLPPVEVGGELWYPRWVTLPMGWSFSVYLAQLAHTHQLELNSTVFRTCLRLGGPLVPRFLQAGEVASEPYIDDLPSLSTSLAAANAGLSDMLAAEVVDAKEEKVQFAQEGKGTRVWGVEVDPDGCFRPPPAKLQTLLTLTRSTVVAGRLSTSGLQRLVGRWLWYCLLHRPLLSCFTPLFRQSRSQHLTVRLWPSSIQALLDLMALVPLLVVDPSRPVGQLCATDASGRGGGMVLNGSFSTDDFWDAASYVYYKGRDDLSSSAYLEGLRTWVEQRGFRTQLGWRWANQAEHIGVKEARALFSGLRRVVLRSGPVLGRRHLFLVDNQGVVGAFSRGRSTNAVINSLITRTAATLLATASTLDLVWIQSAANPADLPSRLW